MRLSRAIRISVVSLFRCAASRNKRAPTGCFIASLYPTFLFDVGGRSLRGPQQRQLRASAAGGFGPRDPKGSQKHGPKHCPVSASLRLRFRSATFPSPAGISSRFCSPQNERNPSLGGRETGFSRADRVFSHVVLCPRALGNLAKTHKRVLTISLFRPRRASVLREGTALTPGGRCLPALGRDSLSPRSLIRAPARPSRRGRAINNRFSLS